MYNVTIQAASAEEFKAKVLDLAHLFGSTSSVAITAAANAPKPSEPKKDGTLTEAEAQKLAAGVATVSAPRQTVAQKKAAAEAAQAAALTAGEAEVDPLAEPEEADPLAEETAYTKEDVTKLLIEMRTARSDKPSLTADLIKECGGKTLSDVPVENYGKLAARAKEELAKAKK